MDRNVRPSSALPRCCLVVAFAITLAFVLHRVDIAVLAVPFVLSPAFYLQRRPARPNVELQLSDIVAAERDVVRGLVTISAPGAVDLLNVDLDPGNFQAVGPTKWTVSLDAGERREIEFELVANRWGQRFVGPATATGFSPALLTEVSPSRSEPKRVAVFPTADLLNAAEDVPHALVSAGAHRSSHTGVGALFSHVRPFDPGDRLRRINWRATLKAQQLHVTATHAERSVRVLIGVDVSSDVGPIGESVLDVSVRAAAAISEHYTSNGDIVGIVEFGIFGRMLRPAPGQRQEQRIRQWLLDIRPSVPQRSVGGEWFAGARVSNSLVMVLTPLLDDHAASSLLTLRQRGASLVAIDTLSVAAQPEANDRVSEAARRLWVLERGRVIRRLSDSGIPVVPWTSTSSLEGVLRDVARIAAGPRLVNR
jgi:uncharacterized protein (DUF58 family)